MPRWLKSRLGASVAAGTLAIGVVGGVAFAVAGPIMSSPASNSTPAASPSVTAATTHSGKACAKAGAASGTASGAAASGTSAPGAGTGAKACAAGRGGILRRLLGRTEHASLTVRGKDGSWVTITLDRGTIKSISSTSITIVRPDGVSVTAPITSGTKFRRATEASLAPGDKVVVVQEGGTTPFVIALGKAGASSSAGSARSTANATSATT